MSREELDKDVFLPPKKFVVVTPSKEEKPKPNQLANNSFYLLSKEIKYHNIYLPTYHPKRLKPTKIKRSR